MLIITADDFGLHPSVNEAVERAYRDGILTTASLMVGAPAAAEAVRRAKTMPELRVGLHLVLADGVPVLPRSAIPDLVDVNGRFRDNMVVGGIRFFFLSRVRRQLAAEIHAQFEKFAATGLLLDHVNTHKHFHLHPTVLSIMLRVGKAYGLRAVRLPSAPDAPFWLRPWMWLMRRRLRAAGIVHNDYMVGLAESGHFDESKLLDRLRSLPQGIGEIYMHPAVISGSAVAPSMQGYHHEEELFALVSPKVRSLIEHLAIPTGSFSDLADAT